jgi:thiaminase
MFQYDFKRYLKANRINLKNKTYEEILSIYKSSEYKKHCLIEEISGVNTILNDLIGDMRQLEKEMKGEVDEKS